MTGQRRGFPVIKFWVIFLQPVYFYRVFLQNDIHLCSVPLPFLSFLCLFSLFFLSKLPGSFCSMLEGKLEILQGLASIDFYLQSHNKCYPHVFGGSPWHPDWEDGREAGRRRGKQKSVVFN